MSFAASEAVLGIGKVWREAFHSARYLQRAIISFLEQWNARPTPFVWTASVERILDKIARAHK